VIEKVGMGNAVPIRDPHPADERQWRQLWAGYIGYYESKIPEEITAATWRRMLDPASAIHGRVAVSNGNVAGFAIYILHEATWTLGPACYLEDLFVAPETRGQGIGRALIDDLMQLGHQRGWSKLYWHTRNGNVTARRLYDTFCLADDFVRYRISIEPGR
jgi:GNAT superfamily N-acetyltransferase